MIAEVCSVFHYPVDHCLKAKVSTGFLGLNPLVPLDFSRLAIEIFFEIHSCTTKADHTYSVPELSYGVPGHLSRRLSSAMFQSGSGCLAIAQSPV